ncbi:MAG: hypothetical protein U0L54_06355 [Bacteroidales bacterium]|nr:hypothetical protein [Bacteroidales bacterium]
MRKNLRKVLWLIAMLVLTSSAFAQRIAVLNFNAGAGVKQNEVDGLSAIFGTYFKPKGAKFIERTRVDKVLQEYKMQKSILTNTDMVAMGEQLNASLVVVGDVTIMLGEYNIDVRVVNVQTAEVVAGDGISFDTNTSPRTTMQHLGERLSKSVELEIEKFKIEEKVEDDQSKGGGSTLPKNMTTKITEDNSKRERTDVVVLYDYLKLYPKDLGEYKNTPYTLIKKINEKETYGYDSWRLPTEEELSIIRSKGYLSGLKYMTQSDPRGVLLLVTTKDPVVHKSKLQIAKHEFSIHGGIGVGIGDIIYQDGLYGLFSTKYKFKPSELSDLRIFGELKVEFYRLNYNFIIGLNLENRINNNISYWTEIGLGAGYYAYGADFRCPLSSEIGLSIGDFLLGLNYKCTWLLENPESILSFSFGYRF